MPRLNEKVLAMVRQEIETDPTITNKALLDKAKKISRAVGRLGPRRFHALYRLRVTREMAANKPTATRRGAGTRKKARKAKAPRKAGRKATPPAAKAPGSPPAGKVDRSAIRAVLLDLAMVVAAAPNTAAAMHLVATLDKYVDRVVAAIE